MAYWSIPPPDTSANPTEGGTNDCALLLVLVAHFQIQCSIQSELVGGVACGEHGADVAERVDQLSDFGVGEPLDFGQALQLGFGRGFVCCAVFMAVTRACGSTPASMAARWRASLASASVTR